jgi:cell division septation protein DedD
MKNERQQRLLFIIPAVIIAIILIICIAVAVGSKSGEKGKKKDSRSVSVTENEQDIVAESEVLELVKKDALKESNVEDKDNKQNDGTQSDTNDNSVAADSNSDNANTASDKSSQDKTAAGQKTSTDSDKTSAGSNNTQKPAGNDSKPEASNQTAAPEPAQSEPAQPEAPKNEYVAPGWIFYGSKAGNGMSGEQKAYVDSLVKQWTDGSISEGELADLFAQKVKNEWGLEMCSAGVSEAYRCIYPSKNDIPDYKSALDESNGFYNFTGLYTKGEYDEYGYLICYMWEAGIF